MIFGRRIIRTQTTTILLLLFLLIIGGEIWRDAGPVSSLIGAAIEVLRTHVKILFILLANNDRCIPVPAQLLLAGHLLGFDTNCFGGFDMDAVHISSLRFSIYRVRIVGIGLHPKTISTVYRQPVAITYTTRCGRGSNPGTIVLQTTHNIVRFLLINGYVIELPHRQILQEQPGSSFIQTHIHPSIGTQIHMIGVIGIDPQRMHITVQPAPFITGFGKGISSITGIRKRIGRAVYPLGIFRIDHNSAEIKRTRHYIQYRALLFPRSTSIGRNI